MDFLSEPEILRGAEENIKSAQKALEEARRAASAGVIESSQLSSWEECLAEAKKAEPGIARVEATKLATEINRWLSRRDVGEALLAAERRAKSRAKSARHAANKAEKAAKNRQMAKFAGCGTKSH